MYLTRSERAILIFLTLSALIGSGIHYYKKITDRLNVKIVPVNPTEEDREVDALLQSSKLVNINTADIDTLKRLPGIGPSLAKEIVDYRDLHGLYKSVETLNNVKGIGPKKLEVFKEYLTIENEQ